MRREQLGLGRLLHQSLRFRPSLSVSQKLMYGLDDFTVIMTTLDLMSRSDLLTAPAKYDLRSHNATSQGRILRRGDSRGIEAIPLEAMSASKGIGILAFATAACPA